MPQHPRRDTAHEKARLEPIAAIAGAFAEVADRQRIARLLID
ncbi:hypothetical protein ABZ814_03005 [Micromonospora musae]